MESSHTHPNVDDILISNTSLNFQQNLQILWATVTKEHDGKNTSHQHPHPEHIQTFQNNLKRGLLLAGFKYEVCKKLQEKNRE